MRRDFLETGRSLAALEDWALEWKARIATLYALNAEHFAHWAPERPLAEQAHAFQQPQATLQAALADMHAKAERQLAQPATQTGLSKTAQTRHEKVLTSLLTHWSGLTVFLAHPQAGADGQQQSRRDAAHAGVRAQEL